MDTKSIFHIRRKKTESVKESQAGPERGNDDPKVTKRLHEKNVRAGI